MPENAPQNIEIGQIIHERYEIIGQLGQGGMATVFRANDMLTKKIVAVKVTTITDDATANVKTERFRNECNSIAKLLNEPTVVGLFDVFQNKNKLYIVLECVAGGTLKHRFNDFGAMTLEELKYYFSRICTALSSAHKINIIHRDIKPDNVLISESGEVKLGDFGIAILNKESPDSKTVVGTPKYMAPEMFLGLEIDTRADIYSLGVMLYEYATGSAPFVFLGGANEKARANTMQMMHIKTIPPLPRKINPKVSPELENLIMQMLEKNPAFRLQTIDEVYNSLIEIDESKKDVKPYLYRSRRFAHGKKRAVIGTTYDDLKKRFRTKYNVVFIIMALVALVCLVVGVVVLNGR